MNSCKNYKTDGGDTTVIGGKLVIGNGAVLEGFAANQANSVAVDVPALVADFNAYSAR